METDQLVGGVHIRVETLSPSAAVVNDARERRGKLKKNINLSLTVLCTFCISPLRALGGVAVIKGRRSM